MFDQLWATTCLYLGLGMRGPPSKMILTVALLSSHSTHALHNTHNASGITRALTHEQAGERSSRQIGFTNGILSWK